MMYLILFVRMTSATSSEEANALIQLGKQWGGVFAVRRETGGGGDRSLAWHTRHRRRLLFRR